MKPDGTFQVPEDVAAHLKGVDCFRVVVLVPENEEEEAWNRLAESELFRQYGDSDSIYDDV